MEEKRVCWEVWEERAWACCSPNPRRLSAREYSNPNLKSIAAWREPPHKTEDSPSDPEQILFPPISGLSKLQPPSEILENWPALGTPGEHQVQGPPCEQRLLSHPR